MNTFGPLQLIVFGVRTSTIFAEIASQFRSSAGESVIRLIDALSVTKDSEGRITVNEVPDEFLEDAAIPGSLATSLFGNELSESPLSPMRSDAGFLQQENGNFGLSHDQILEIADLIPGSSRALFLLVEQRWALHAKQAVVRDGESVLANGLITPATLNELRRQNTRPLD